jgi:hypothetical protein
VAWRRAVDGDRADGTGLSDVLVLLGPAAESSSWDCDGVEAVGPLADGLLQEADAGPVPGALLTELAAGITCMVGGVFAATRPGDDRPWLTLRVSDGGQFVVATRSRALLDDLRRRFRDQPVTVGSAVGED